MGKRYLEAECVPNKATKRKTSSEKHYHEYDDHERQERHHEHRQEYRHDNRHDHHHKDREDRHKDHKDHHKDREDCQQEPSPEEEQEREQKERYFEWYECHFQEQLDDFLHAAMRIYKRKMGQTEEESSEQFEQRCQRTLDKVTWRNTPCSKSIRQCYCLRFEYPHNICELKRQRFYKLFLEK